MSRPSDNTTTFWARASFHSAATLLMKAIVSTTVARQQDYKMRILTSVITKVCPFAH